MKSKAVLNHAALSVLILAISTLVLASCGSAGGDPPADFHSSPSNSSISVSSTTSSGVSSSSSSSSISKNGVTIDKEHFPDAAFRSYVSTEFDKNNDGSLSKSEISAVTSISARYQNITSLKGVEYFTNLKILNCENNCLTSLDVSNNPLLEELWVSHNNLTYLDVSCNPKLYLLDCSNNDLTRLNTSNNHQLLTLYCYSNDISYLDLSRNTALQDLWCFENKLAELDVSHNPDLITLHCKSNQIKILDVSHNTLLGDDQPLEGEVDCDFTHDDSMLVVR